MLCKHELPMDVDFMLSDSLDVCCHSYRKKNSTQLVLQAVRPKMTVYKNIEAAATAVDVMLQQALQDSGCKLFCLYLFRSN